MPISPDSYSQTPGVPRLSLRKRSFVQSIKSEVNLTAVNSAFLSGLFADVAAAQSDNQYTSATPYQSEDCLSVVNSCVESDRPNKKSRLDLKSISRCAKSFKALRDLELVCISPDRESTSFVDIPDSDNLIPMNHNDSLLFQLRCVANPGRTDNSAPVKTHPASLIFPQLPNTISNTSCSSSLTRNLSDLHSALVETTAEKEASYGWFVEMDDEDDSRQHLDPYKTSRSSVLAFCAPTAPKASDFDEELEWAKAADTVDDVLGDFF
jgi:hypothetical protein